MSEWLRLTAEIKRRPLADNLTTTQRQSWATLNDLLRFPQRLNLYGPCGCGKTFLAWATAQTTGAVHVPLPDMLEGQTPGTEIILLDNAPADEYAVRRVFAICDLLEIQSVVIITRQPVAMPMRALAVPPPTMEDLDQISRTLGRLGYYPQRPLSAPANLWDLLHSYI